MGESSSGWSLEDLLEEGTLSRTLSGRSAEHSGRTASEKLPATTYSDGFTTAGDVGSTAGLGESIGGLLIEEKNLGYQTREENGRKSAELESPNKPASIDFKANGLAALISKVESDSVDGQSNHSSKEKSSSTNGVESEKAWTAPNTKTTVQVEVSNNGWNRVHNPQPIESATKFSLQVFARLVLSLVVFLSDVIMGLVTAVMYSWQLFKQPTRESFIVYIHLIILAIREGTIETFDSLSICFHRLLHSAVFLRRRIKVWVLTYGEQLPGPVMDFGRQATQNTVQLVSQVDKSFTRVDAWSQKWLLGKQGSRPKLRKGKGWGAYTLVMTLLVLVLSLRLAFNIVTNGGLLHQAIEPPRDPFDVTLIFEQLEADSFSSMGSPDIRTHSRNSGLVSDHDLTVLNELKERREREKMEERSQREAERKLLEVLKVVEQERPQEANDLQKKGGYFGWLKGGGQDEESGTWPPPVHTEETHIRLQNGNMMPRLGFGTAGLGEDTGQAVKWALEAGYRLFDTATAREWYRQDELGMAIKESGIPREHLFLVTKIHPRDMTIQGTKDALESALADLHTSYVDLVLLHYPRCYEELPGCVQSGKLAEGSWMDGWTALETLYWQGKARSLGMANFDMRQGGSLHRFASVKPHVFQTNSDLVFSNKRLVGWAKYKHMTFMGYSTLGNQWVSEGFVPNPVLYNPIVERIAEHNNCTRAQVVLRWALSMDQVIIPRSHDRAHIFENIEVLKGTCQLERGELEALGSVEALGVDQIMVAIENKLRRKQMEEEEEKLLHQRRQ